MQVLEVARRRSWIDVALSLDSQLLRALLFVVHRATLVAMALASSVALWPEARLLALQLLQKFAS